MADKNESLNKKKKILRTLLIAAVIAAIVLAVYLPLKLTGTLDKVDSADSLKEIINGFGAWSRVIFAVLQFLQVTFLPLPAMVTTLAGVYLFGPWETTLLSIIAIMLGRLFAFFLGRKIGVPVVKWMIGKEDMEKWADILARGKYTFFLMLVLPFFPDDILCMVAGITSITWKFFIIANIVGVTIACFTICFFTSGQIIPFSGWGIPVWIVIGIALVVLFICSFKYKDKIESFVTSLGEKMNKKFGKKKSNDIIAAAKENKSETINETDKTAVTANNANDKTKEPEYDKKDNAER